MIGKQELELLKKNPTMVKILERITENVELITKQLNRDDVLLGPEMTRCILVGRREALQSVLNLEGDADEQDVRN